MKPASEWSEADIQELITDRVQESLTLDYKACAALEKTDDKKRELSKDVSAFANSAGGEIVYGVLEDKHFPTKINVGYDLSAIKQRMDRAGDKQQHSAPDRRHQN